MDNEQQPSDQPKRRRFSTRGFTSLLSTLALLVMTFSGVMLYLTPRGRTANWTDWTLLGLGKDQWGSLHMNGSLLFVLVMVLHLVINWSALLGYLRRKTVSGLHMKKELALATLIAAVLVAGTVTDLTPFDYLANLNYEIKNYWDGQTAQAPVPHAEELTLIDFAVQIDLPVEQVTEALEKEGYAVESTSVTVGQIGQSRNVSPEQVMAAVRKHHPQVSAGGQTSCESDTSQPDGEHGPGFGRGMGAGRGMGWGRGMGQGAGGGFGHDAHADGAEQDTDVEPATDQAEPDDAQPSL